MLIAGGYLFFQSIIVRSHFGLGYRLFGFGNFNITSGMLMVPFIFGIGMIFYNAKNIIGWILSVASLVMLTFGVITSINFTFRHMTALAEKEFIEKAKETEPYEYLIKPFDDEMVDAAIRAAIVSNK
ncbi:MAG: hypothetical protein GY909_00170 [Oligoflexia bacterium]|nr:hypothetical protein [Oligoflexia bacterium]